MRENIKLKLLALFLILFGFFSTSLIFNKIKWNNEDKLNQIPETAAVINTELTKPKYFYINNDAENKPKVSALSYLVGDLGTGEIILTKNEKAKYPIASVSKLMTALIAKEIVKDDDVAKISKKALATLGGNGELKVGEKIKVNDLIYPLLLESSNDAAEAIAEYFDRAKFIGKMNEGAKSLKMMDTTFEDPSGLSKNNQSTVLDMFKLAGYLNQKKQDLFQITTKIHYANKVHNWFNIGQFVNKDGFLGGKSGSTDAAMQTVISTFSLPLGEHISRPIAITLLKSKDRRKDVETILKYLKKNVYYGGPADANSDWIKEKLSVPDEEPDFVNLVFGGDIMLARGVKNSVEKNLKGNYGALFEKVDILKKADIVFANLEGTASDKGVDIGNLYSFHMDPSVIPALKSVGIDILSMTNNHVGDWGVLAYIDTLNRLKENEIFYTGGGKDAIEAENPTIIEKYGMKIGYLGFSDVGPNYMYAGEDKIGLLLANNPRFDEIIKNANSLVDYLIVSFHFGEEYKPIHNKRQESLAHRAIDNGAKIIVGHHPHVAQDTEVYKDGYIMYSLGNFIFDQKFSTETMKGLLVQIRLNKSGSMSVIKNTTHQNKFFQIEKVIKSKEEKIKLSENKSDAPL